MKWKPIKGYEGLYSVSNNGNIRNDKTGNFIGQWVFGGYMYVKLCKDYKTKTLRVHKLVADAFCKKTDGKTEVNHINGDKSDNRTKNLEWVTHGENMVHAVENGLIKKTSKGYIKRVVCLEDGKVHNGAGAASRYYGVSQSSIYTCCRRKGIGRNYTFRFEDDLRKEE